MNYMIIDLEMCRVPRNCDYKRYKYAREIIQIGAVLLDESYQKISCFNEYVSPKYGVMDHYISSLTGIPRMQIIKAYGLEEVLAKMMRWIGEKDYQVIAWSDNDFTQLKHEIKAKKIESPEINNFICEERWIDYQKVFGNRYGYNRSISLVDALLLCDIEPEGEMHNGLMDAINTARLVKKIEQNPEYQLNNETRKKELTTEPLQSSLGSLISGLNLKLA